MSGVHIELPAEQSSQRSPQRTGRSLGSVAFPGRRDIWLLAAVVFAIALVGIAIALLQPREDLVGTNGVGAHSDTAIVPTGGRMCVPRLRIPAGTGQIEFNLDSRTLSRPALEVSLREVGGNRVIRGFSPSSPSGGGHRFYAVSIPTLPAQPAFVLADVCLTPKAEVIGWGTWTLQGNVQPPTVDGKTLNARVTVRFLGPRGATRTIASQIGEMFRRAALFRPGFVGAWTYWVLFLLVFPVLAYSAVRLLATADTHDRRRVPLPVLVGALAFSVIACWALITPAFESPDESEHFAYVQYFAETGEAVQTTPTAREPYSDAEILALQAVNHTGVIERSETRPPWLKAEEVAYEEEVRKFHGPNQSNGGGFHPAISTHTPAYYALLAPAYLATKHDSVFTELFATRLTSALMGALTAVLAMLVVGELLPGRRTLAVAAGLLVAFEPMFAYTAGAVNNDNGVNLAAALLIYLLIRALRRGLTVPLAIAIGATMVAAPILKGTGYELYPPAILALLFAMFRRHASRNWLALGTLVVTVLVLQAGWSELAHVFHRTTFTTPGGGTPGSGLEAFNKPKTYLSWMARFMLPFKPPFVNHDWTIIHWPFFNVYIERGFASFGWYAIFFPKWVYLVIVAALVAAAVAAAILLLRKNGIWLRHWPEIIFLALVPIAVIGAVEANFEPSLAIIPLGGTPEEGRYAFPAIVAVAALFIGATNGFGRRRAALVASGTVACLIGFTLASQLLTLSAFYT